MTNQLGLGFESAMIGIRTTGPPETVADEIARWDEADYVSSRPVSSISLSRSSALTVATCSI